jgi:site-specific DNA-methyltransferase (adenine-specific)
MTTGSSVLRIGGYQRTYKMGKSMKEEKIRAGRNRTITLTREDIFRLKEKLLTLNARVNPEEITNKTIQEDLFECMEYLPEGFVDLLFIDPPYNLTKEFNSNKFKEMSADD